MQAETLALADQAAGREGQQGPETKHGQAGRSSSCAETCKPTAFLSLSRHLHNGDDGDPTLQAREE